MQNKRTPASNVALGGILAALALVLMNLGTLIPVATYTCPMLCALILELVRRICGSRIAWAWYGAVAILSVLMAPDKEAAAVFVFIGYYPVVKPKLDGKKGKWIWKALLFNTSILTMYALLLYLFGLEGLVEDFSGMGAGMTAVLLILGNVTFCLLDKLLERRFRK